MAHIHNMINSTKFNIIGITIKKRALGVVINKVEINKGRNDCAPKNIYPRQKK